MMVDNTPQWPLIAREVTAGGLVHITSYGEQLLSQIADDYRNRVPACEYQATCPACHQHSEIRWAGYRARVYCPACGAVMAEMEEDA